MHQKHKNLILKDAGNVSSIKGKREWKREGKDKIGEEASGGGNLEERFRDEASGGRNLEERIGGEEAGGGNLENSYLRKELLVLKVSGKKSGGDALPDDQKLGRAETQEEEIEEEEEVEEKKENEDMCVRAVAGQGASGDEISVGRLEAVDGKNESDKVGGKKEMGGEILEEQPTWSLED